MHEFAIARALLTAACETLRRAGANRARGLTCRIGALRQAQDELLREAFALAADGTPCAGAALHVIPTYLRAMCAGCAGVFEVRDWEWRCPVCGGEGRALGGGDELELVSIEIDGSEAEPHAIGAAACERD
ncbi:MAG: hydrogenase maturation nickel metallochaperone HypA [Phycisphaerae bacterium]|nr:hydrogenase maturation nickel metallochaperone HypA [Phycisphaerae bacterium]